MSPEKKSKIFKKRATKRWSAKSDEYKKEWGRKLTEARIAKRKLSTTHATQDTPPHVS